MLLIVLGALVVVQAGLLAAGWRALAAARAGQATLEDALEDATRAAGDAARAAEHAQADALEARTQRARFLVTVSREVRTPLTGVVGMASLLLDSELNDRQRQQARTILACGESLLELVNDALELSRVEAGELAPTPGVFSLLGLVDQAIELASQQADGKDLNIAGLCDPTLPSHVLGDAGLLRGVLVHLLGNAVRYTPMGDVALRVSPRADGRVRFEVTDSGPGLTEEARRTLFEPFAAPGARGQPGGAGLGLALCRRVVEGLGGTLGVESRPGRGSTFWFELALPTSDPALPVDPTTGEVLPPRPPGQAIGAPQGRVLLAEDNPVNQQVATALLRRLGYEVEVAPDGAQALALATAQAFDAVLMDCEMPELDGFEAARRIRTWEAGRTNPGHLPIVAMTAHALRGDRERCLEAGMDDYIAKPVDLARLGRVMARWVGHGPAELPATPPEPTEELPAPAALAQAAVAGLPLPLARGGGRTPRLPTPGARTASTFIFEEPEADELLVDVSGLRELEAGRPRGAPSPMKAILHSFLEESATDMARIRAATAEVRAEELSRALHRLKGASSTVGALSLAARCSALEEQVRAGLVDDLGEQLSDLERVYAGTLELLQAEADAL